MFYQILLSSYPHRATGYPKTYAQLSISASLKNNRLNIFWLNVIDEPF
jgi:hypothetical protein